MEGQKQRSRAGSKMQGDVFLASDVDVKGLPKTIFLGYDQPSADVTVKALFVGGQKVEEAKDGDNIAVILDQTPFYAEQGGQAADVGFLKGRNGTVEVKDTQKQSDVYIHTGVVKGTLKAGEVVKASIDGERRMAIMRNHTATHLLQAAMRQVLGEHVKQQGSLVDPDRLRFDFTHPKAVTKDEIVRIEDAVNSFIRRCEPVLKKVMTQDEAKKSGALAFFAEKYGETVRVVSVGEISSEFCGGTHLDVTGQIGLFKIISEGAVAQGIRRIEAVTGTGALKFVRSREQLLEKAALVLKASPDDLVLRVEQQTKRIKDLEKEAGNLNFEVIKGSITDVISRAEQVRGVAFIAHSFKGVDMETLRRVSDLIKQRCPTVVALLAATTADDGALIISMSDDLAQAGCKDPGKLTAVFDNIRNIVKESITV
jgi:alanyl-tRNA synthetase